MKKYKEYEQEVMDAISKIMQPNSKGYKTMQGVLEPVKGVRKPVEPRSMLNRNDPCTCGSNKKYKKCCML
jgi:uncharacterized protein YecA (UPF0149 family)